MESEEKIHAYGIAAVLILATMVGGTLAALNTKSEKAVANISIKSVGDHGDRGSACGTGRRRGKRTGYDRTGGKRSSCRRQYKTISRMVMMCM
mgnify:CR=1 FL=1